LTRIWQKSDFLDLLLLMNCAIIYVIPAQSPQAGLLLWGAKVTKTLFGKRLLCAHSHTAQRSEQHRPGSFAPLTLTPGLYPSAKSPMPLSNAQAIICSARFGRSCLPEKEKWQSRNKIKIRHCCDEPSIT
jgi:hypothetical protein